MYPENWAGEDETVAPTSFSLMTILFVLQVVVPIQRWRLPSPGQVYWAETKSNNTKYYSQSMSSPTIPSPPTSSASLLSIVKIDGKLDSIQQQQIEMMSAVTELTSKMSLLMERKYHHQRCI